MLFNVMTNVSLHVRSAVEDKPQDHEQQCRMQIDRIQRPAACAWQHCVLQMLTDEEEEEEEENEEEEADNFNACRPVRLKAVLSAHDRSQHNRSLYMALIGQGMNMGHAVLWHTSCKHMHERLCIT